MFGNVLIKNKNAKGHFTFGFIQSEDGTDYFFHKTNLSNCTIQQLEEGDSVEFEIDFDDTKQKSYAINVRKRFSSSEDSSETIVTAGRNKAIISYDDKSEDEKKIITELEKIFYITNAGHKISVGQSEYNYILAKPTESFKTLFKIEREFVIVFSDYVSFEPRSLDVAAKIIESIPSKLRLEKGIQVLISNDSRIEEKIVGILHSQDQNLDSIVIPFSYRELLYGTVSETGVQDRFRKFLFDVDLFATNSPIENDSFFFGRRDYVRDIVAKCKSSIHCGIFGLRRSGKTSCLLAIKRILEQENYKVLFVPCQSDLKTTNWKTALYYIVCGMQSISKTDVRKIHTEDDYKKNSANIFFEEDMCACLKSFSTPVTIMFDEIEAITFGVDTSGVNWKEGDSYLHFWDIIRGFCSKYPQKLSIVVAGTNPMINELPAINEKGLRNPMCGQLSTSNQGAYLPPFNEDNTKAMVNTLGGYMGISFNQEICSKLTYDCGGHPYLIRLFCSCINNYVKNNQIKRPVIITKPLYEKTSSLFEKSGEAEDFYLMILNILHRCYEKEYNALKILATEGDSQIAQTLDNKALLHLLGYGLIENNSSHYAIRFETIKRFLQGKYKFERQGLTIDEQEAEISLRFGTAEKKMRELVRNILRQSKGVEEGKKIVLSAMRKNRAVQPNVVTRAETISEYRQLFDTTVNTGMYYTTLILIIVDNFPLFSNVFNEEKHNVEKHLWILNDSRRIADHSAPSDAKNWTIEDFNQFRKSMIWCEEILREFD